MNTNEKLRDGLETIIKRIDEAIKTDNAQFLTGALLHIRETAKGMLALPRRNCDVGSAKEQKQRFDVFCSRGNCDNCPLAEEGVWANCAIRWSQMPYEKGVEE